jgi:putative transposase
MQEKEREGLMARVARIKQESGGGYYHCMTRVASGEFIFGVKGPGSRGAEAAEKFRDLMRKLADFHEIEIVTWALLSNHTHILCREPEFRREWIADGELVAKVLALNGPNAAAELEWQLQHFREELKQPELAEKLKARYLARMGNVSRFMQELKGRFAQWYNRKHKRHGVLWSERFKSVLVEGDPEVLLAVAAYIDLNAVRAGLVTDPADYRYCGYGEAVSGNVKMAKSGLIRALRPEAETDSNVSKDLWKKLQAEYRKLLYGVGVAVTKDGHVYRKGATPGRVIEVQEREKGELSLAELLRKRIRYFTAGLAIGSRAFVNEVFEHNRGRFGTLRKDGARTMKGGDWGKLRTLRDLRKVPIE